jgi:hypothetical protein
MKGERHIPDSLPTNRPVCTNLLPFRMLENMVAAEDWYLFRFIAGTHRIALSSPNKESMK